ncbi:GNAT family N-acetyltransferase [Holosporaceae bacterium 'Namur']|nr:GNAT family N-acetyltransferase [Holosporaceae bacterium 'Namur']
MVKIEQTPLTEQIKNTIFKGFAEHAIERTGIDGINNAISFVAYQGNEFIGAIVVELFWSQLHIKYLYVKKEYRGQNLGNQLTEHALNSGRSHKCDFAFVETMSFQALDFYKKVGFELEFTRAGYAKNTSFHYLKKYLLTILLSR